MTYIRQLPSGRWQAILRGTDGRRSVMTDDSREVVEHWAQEPDERPRCGRRDVYDLDDVAREFGVDLTEGDDRIDQILTDGAAYVERARERATAQIRAEMETRRGRRT